MRERRHTAIAAVLFGCVLLVFVSPAINLPYSTLQGSRHAALLLTLIASFAWAGILMAAFQAIGALIRDPVLLFPSDSLIDITCTRRC